MGSDATLGPREIPESEALSGEACAEIMGGRPSGIASGKPAQALIIAANAATTGNRIEDASSARMIGFPW
ncbi:MAG: hypothetical protein AAF559_09265 [Pseudomonadota bacterium]